MGKKRGKKRKQVEKPFCWYCGRTFNDEKILVQHQKAKHFKCRVCNKKLSSISGMVVHVYQVHKENVTKVPNAKPGRDDIKNEIYGMDGIPPTAAPDGSLPNKKPKLLGPVGMPGQPMPYMPRQPMPGMHGVAPPYQGFPPRGPFPGAPYGPPNGYGPPGGMPPQGMPGMMNRMPHGGMMLPGQVPGQRPPHLGGPPSKPLFPIQGAYGAPPPQGTLTLLYFVDLPCCATEVVATNRSYYNHPAWERSKCAKTRAMR